MGDDKLLREGNLCRTGNQESLSRAVVSADKLAVRMSCRTEGKLCGEDFFLCLKSDGKPGETGIRDGSAAQCSDYCGAFEFAVICGRHSHIPLPVRRRRVSQSA